MSYATPLYYANQVIQHLITPNGALSESWLSLSALPLYGAVVLFLATRTLKEFD